MSDSSEQSDTSGPRRLGSALRDAGKRGRDELTRPGGIGDSAHGAFRRWCQRAWRSRGGGLYAVGFMVSFLYFETLDILFDDVPKVFTTNWVSGEAWTFAVDFFVDTLLNIVYASIWPVYVIQWQTPAGVLVLVAMFYLFPRLVQKPIERWMFEGEAAPDLKAEKALRKRQKAEKKAEKKAAKRAARVDSRGKRDA